MAVYDVLLINTPFTWSKRFYEAYPPLNLLYIAAVLEKANFSVELIDISPLEIAKQNIMGMVSKVAPQIIGISSMTQNVEIAYHIAKIAKGVLPHAMVVVGGPHFSALPRQTLEECSDIDMVIVGEGEYTMLEFIQALKDQSDFSNVKGLMYKKEGKFIYTGPRSLIENLDLLPFPARHLLIWEKYHPLIHRSIGSGKKKARFATMVTSRGCPFGCIYCDKSVFGRTWRARSPNNVVSEIEHMVNEYGVEEIVIHDDLFTLDKSRVAKICNLIIERGLSIKWTADSRVDTVDKELLTKMKEAGCYAVFFGIESGSQKILDSIKKGITLEQAKRAVRWSKEVGLSVTVSFMLGNPGEDERTIKETIQFSKELNADIAHFNMTTPFPGSDLYFLLKEKGALRNDVGWSSYDPQGRTAVFYHENFSPEEFGAIIRRAYREFYFRPQYILERMFKVRDFWTYARGLSKILKMT